jgi:hypothetical protein
MQHWYFSTPSVIAERKYPSTPNESGGSEKAEEVDEAGRFTEDEIRKDWRARDSTKTRGVGFVGPRMKSKRI